MKLANDNDCELHGCNQNGHTVCTDVFTWSTQIGTVVQAMLADGGNTILPTYSTQLTALLAENFPTTTTT